MQHPFQYLSMINQLYGAKRLHDCTFVMDEFVANHPDEVHALARSDGAFLVKYCSCAALSATREVLKRQKPGPGDGFVIDFSLYTKGAVGEVTIPEFATKYLERSPQNVDGGLPHLHEFMSETYKKYGYNSASAPSGLLYLGFFMGTDIALTHLFAENVTGVADIGCGSGALSLLLSQLGARRFVLIDIDPVALDIAREITAQANLPNVQVLSPEEVDQADVTDINLVTSFRSWAYKYPFDEYSDLLTQTLPYRPMVITSAREGLFKVSDPALRSSLKWRREVPCNRDVTFQIMKF